MPNTETGLLRRDISLQDAKLECRQEQDANGNPVFTGEFSGYAVVYNRIDTYGTIFAPGCFNASIREQGIEDIVVLENHDMDRARGKYIDWRDEQTHLWVRGKITDFPAGRDLHALMADRVVKGLSVGFLPPGPGDSTIDPQTGIETFHRLTLRECSPVLRNSVPDAKINEVRFEGMTRRQIEKDLQRNTTITRNSCKAAAIVAEMLDAGDIIALADYLRSEDDKAKRIQGQRDVGTGNTNQERDVGGSERTEKRDVGQSIEGPREALQALQGSSHQRVTDEIAEKRALNEAVLELRSSIPSKS